MPRYAVDFIADIEELNDYPGSEHKDYLKGETKAENNDSGTAMGNVQCLFTIGERQRNRSVVVSRGTQVEKTVQPQFTSIRQENISSVRGIPLTSDYTSQFLQTTLRSSSASSTSNGQQEEVIMGRLPNELPSKFPPDLKDSIRLKHKREQLLQKLKIDATEDEPDSLSDTLSNMDMKCELQEQIPQPRFYGNLSSEKASAPAVGICGDRGETRPKANVADVLVVSDEVSDEVSDNINNKKKRRKKANLDFPSSFKMTERGDSDPRLRHLSEALERNLYVNEPYTYNQNTIDSNTSNTKCSSQCDPRVRRYNRRRSHTSELKSRNDKNQLSGLNHHRTTTSSDENYSRLKRNEMIPLTNLPPRPPRFPQITPIPHQLERPSNIKRRQPQTPRNQSNISNVPSSPIEAVIEHNIVTQGDYNLDSPPINPSPRPCPRTFPFAECPTDVRIRSHSEPRGLSPKGFYYPSRIPQPVTHKFYVSESDGIGDILADTTDRRIKAVCDRHRCDIAIYSPIVRGGYMKYIVMLTAPSASEMKKCVRSLDTTLKWNLSSQLK